MTITFYIVRLRLIRPVQIREKLIAQTELLMNVSEVNVYTTSRAGLTVRFKI